MDARVASALPPPRLERLSAWMEAELLDAVVLSSAGDVTYLSGYARYFGGPSALVVGRDGERTLVVARGEVPVAEGLAEADAVRGFGERGFGLELDPLPLLAEVVASVPAVASARRLGSGGGLLDGRVPAELVPAGEAVWRLRTRKDADELAKIGHSYALCWLGQRAVAEAAQSGEAREIDLFSAAHAAAQRAHGEPIEFWADLLSGPSTAEVCGPIRIAGTRVAAPGEPVIADVVVRAGGYAGDTAETHVVGSNSEIEAARATLLDILAAVGKGLRPCVTGADVFRAMKRGILDAFPGGEFPHHGGHAIGLTGFEDPHLISSDETPLESGMVLAVEPGVYFPGRWGARVENVFVVTAEGGVELRKALS